MTEQEIKDIVKNYIKDNGKSYIKENLIIQLSCDVEDNNQFITAKLFIKNESEPFNESTIQNIENIDVQGTMVMQLNIDGKN